MTAVTTRVLHGVLVFFLLAALVTPFVSAIAASPASVTFNAKDGDAHYSLTVTNDENRALAITLTPSGPLASAFRIGDGLTQFTLPPGESRAVPITLTVPESVQPGTIESGILVEAGVASGANMVAASASVMHVVRLVTPNDGAFLSGELVSSSGIMNSTVFVTLALTNTGNQAVTASPVVFLDGKRIPLDPVTLAPGESKQTVVPWTPRAIGQYETSAVVTYAGKQNTFGTVITVGTLAVDFTDVSFGDFRLGEPFRVSATLLNSWGAPIPITVTASLTQGGSVITKSLPVTQDVDPLREERYTLFIETNGAHVGNATVALLARYADREASYTQDVVLGVDSIAASSTPVIVQGTRWGLGIVIALGIGLLIVAISFIYRRKLHR